MGLEALRRDQAADKRRVMETWKRTVLERMVVVVQARCRCELRDIDVLPSAGVVHGGLFVSGSKAFISSHLTTRAGWEGPPDPRFLETATRLRKACEPGSSAVCGSVCVEKGVLEGGSTGEGGTGTAGTRALILVPCLLVRRSDVAAL